MKTLIIALALAGILLATTAQAACRYCGSRLICEGDSIATLLERCGAPLLTREVALERQDHLGRKRTELVELWIYRAPYGALKGFRTYTVQGGKVVRIE